MKLGQRICADAELTSKQDISKKYGKPCNVMGAIRLPLLLCMWWGDTLVFDA